MGLLDKIKQAAQSTSENKNDFFYTKDGDKKRIRMLCEIDDGFEVVFHSSYQQKINVPCQKQFGRDCPYCNNTKIDDLKDKTQFVFPVYNQGEAKQQILMGTAFKNFSAIMPLVEEAEEEGTVTDRDYIIKHVGKTLDKTITVRGQKPAKLEQNIKPWTKAEMMEKIDKAYPLKVNIDVEVDEDGLPF
jgi:hypothetical protein